MAVSALELVEDLQVRSGWSNREAAAVVHTLERRLEALTSDLVKRDQLDAKAADLRGDIAALRGDFAELRGELKSDFAGLKGEVKSDLAALRSELKTDIAQLHSVLRAQTVWFAGSLFAAAGLIIAALRLLP